ncbi:MAG: EscU/YscU/HrcU family type III secretion system export apparatus switch protein [Pirellulales bacterium]|nr:EscU/YscU/HrcU family type III secretion system export apparatus switch protein [Pirellulales bacterium]
MSDQSGEKTQDATPHRRQQAREQGHVAYSQDLGSAALLIIGVMLLQFWGGQIIETTGSFLRHQLGSTGPLVVDSTDMIAQSQKLIFTLGKVMLPLLGLLFLAGIAGSIFQTGFLFVPDKLTPDLKRLSPLRGWKRIVSLSGAMKLGFGMFKVGVISVVAGAVLYLRHEEVLTAAALPVRELAPFLIDVTLSTALWVGIALFALALFDFAYQKWKHEQDLRMTNQEVRDELKNMQGDPQIFARRRAVQRQMALNRMGDKVPQAHVIVTNPTELAVAIQYDPETMVAPLVVAKGAGVLAQRIRRSALEHNIPVVERKPLAQLLYKEVEPGRPVPDQSYATVAEVLAYVYQLQGKKMPSPPPVG